MNVLTIVRQGGSGFRSKQDSGTSDPGFSEPAWRCSSPRDSGETPKHKPQAEKRRQPHGTISEEMITDFTAADIFRIK